MTSKKKPMSKGEFNSVKSAVGGFEKMLDESCKDKDLLALFNCLIDEQKEDKMFKNQILIKTPIVRNGKKATVGYTPDVWKTWE